MDNLLTVLLQIGGAGMFVSGAFTKDWVKMSLGFSLLAIAPFVGRWLMHRADPKIAEAERYHAEKRAKKAAEKYRQNHQEQIGFVYFKATFLFAGHIAHADGVVCDNERQAFEDICQRLQLDKAQVEAAQDYFNQGRNPQFDVMATLNEFVASCGDIDALRENFIQTQFAFAQASGQVVFTELRILEVLSSRLNARDVYQSLLEEYRLMATEHAETLAQQKINDLKRQRDKKRIEAEKARIEQEEQEKLARLTPAQRELRLAFATLGIKATKDKATIKRAYREQIKRHHPDYLLSQGYPEALLQEATERSVKINQAYKLLKNTLNFT